MPRPLLILGAGESGLAAAALAAAEGRKGWVLSEKSPSAEVCGRLAEQGFHWQAEWRPPADAEVIVSPGIPASHPWLVALKEAGHPYLPEFEWAASRLHGPQIAITGSLGKTSMLMLAGALLRSAGYRVTLSGNIGPPVSEVARTQPRADFHLLELSSFQLENTRAYRPDAGICLNLFPNHLDRHGDLIRYAEAKARLFRFQQSGDLAVWPADYPLEVRSAANRVRAEELPLPPCRGTIFASGPLRRNLQFLFAGLSGIRGMEPEKFEQEVAAFRFPEHRLQWLEIPGAGPVIDDSKSTCLSATRAAVESVAGPLQLVMGGLDKAEDFGLLRPLLQARRPALYLFGAAAKKMAAAWQDSVDVCRTYDTLENLLNALWSQRFKGQILLFSPGCASFDQFPGYAARGQTFQQLVTRLARDAPIL